MLDIMNCYTYRIEWSKFNKSYYGVQYGVESSPKNLWKTYFTSSNQVKKFVELHGKPDIIQVRKTFGENQLAALMWEAKILRRLKVGRNNNWLNLVNTVYMPTTGFHNVPWNKGKSKENCTLLQEIGGKISNTCKRNRLENRQRKPHPKMKRTRRMRNAWNQIVKHNPAISKKFTSYYALGRYLKKNHERFRGLSILAANELGLTDNVIQTAMRFFDLPINKSANLAKIMSRYSMRWKTIDAYEHDILKLHHSGTPPYTIARELQINGTGVVSTLKRHGLTPHRGKTGPRPGYISLPVTQEPPV